MEKKAKFHLSKPWQRVIAMVCVIAMLISMFSYLANVKINENDGIGADTLAKYDEYVNADAADRAKYAASSLLSSDSTFAGNYQRASVYIGKAEYEKALECIQLCIDELKESAADTELKDDIWLKYGCLQAVLGNYDEALKGFANISKESPYRSESALISAQIALERSDMPAAYGHLKAYLERTPDDSSVYGLFADVCYYTQRQAEALAWYEKAASAGTELTGAEYLLWGMCQMDAGAYASARETMDKAVEAGYEDTGLCLSQSAVCSYLLGEYDKVIEQGEQALEVGSETVDAGMLTFYMGMSAFSLENYSQALEYFASAEEIGCKEEGLTFYRGFSHLMLEEADAAIADFTLCIEGGGQLKDSALLYRGICLLQKENIQDAKRDLEEAAESSDASVSESAKALLEEM